MGLQIVLEEIGDQCLIQAFLKYPEKCNKQIRHDLQFHFSCIVARNYWWTSSQVPDTFYANCGHLGLILIFYHKL